MEFGKVDTVKGIDFTLPADPTSNTSFLSGKQDPSFQFYLGGAKWSRPDWVGKLYEKGTPAAKMLSQYALSFNSIELNATFYNLFRRDTVQGWKETVDENFKFCPKFYQGITHRSRLRLEKDYYTDSFLKMIDDLGDRLGPCFIQLPEQFGVSNWSTLEAYVERLPKDLSFHLELRHPNWYADEDYFQRVKELLHTNNAGWVITDTAGRRDMVHTHLSCKEVFIRFVGNNLDESDYSRIDDWVERLIDWKQKGLQSVYFFIHQPDELHTPELSHYMGKQLIEAGIEVKMPRLISNQGELF